MNYDEMLAMLTDLNNSQHIALHTVPHCSNLITQLNKRIPTKQAFFERILPIYVATRTVVFDIDDIAGYVNEVVAKVNQYMNLFWPHSRNPFVHQADFTSSIVPEMLCLLFWHIISHSGLTLEVSAQKDLAIECIFEISGGGAIRFKNKRVDVAVTKPCSLVFEGQNAEFPIPLMAIECKTNLDKNMISGIEHSVNELKKTFPECRYYVITEASDFNVNLNYASSGIDEIYILRQQKRATIRRNPALRNPLNSELIIDIANALAASIANMETELISLNTRMQSGKLIGRNV